MLNLKRLSPFMLHREFDTSFDRLFSGGEATGPTEVVAPVWWPAIESDAGDGKLRVRVALRGVDPKDVEVSVSDSVLTIKGERKAGREAKEGGYPHHEFACGRFERTLALPEGVDVTQVEAKYTNGMLEVTVPAPLAATPRKVEIQIDGHRGEQGAIKAA